MSHLLALRITTTIAKIEILEAKVRLQNKFVSRITNQITTNHITLLLVLMSQEDKQVFVTIFDKNLQSHIQQVVLQTEDNWTMFTSTCGTGSTSRIGSTDYIFGDDISLILMVQ